MLPAPREKPILWGEKSLTQASLGEGGGGGEGGSGHSLSVVATLPKHQVRTHGTGLGPTWGCFHRKGLTELGDWVTTGYVLHKSSLVHNRITEESGVCGLRKQGAKEVSLICLQVVEEGSNFPSIPSNDEDEQPVNMGQGRGPRAKAAA